jgi:hypothetical protein
MNQERRCRGEGDELTGAGESVLVADRLEHGQGLFDVPTRLVV